MCWNISCVPERISGSCTPQDASEVHVSIVQHRAFQRRLPLRKLHSAVANCRIVRSPLHLCRRMKNMMQEPDMDKEWLLGFLQVWQRPLPPVAQLHCAPACVWLHAWILSAGALWGLKSLNPGWMAHPSPRCWYLRCHPCGSLLLHCTMPGMPFPALALRLKVAKVEQTAFHAGPWLPNSGRSVCLCQTPWSKLAACSEVRRALFGKVARQCSWPAALGCMKPIFRVLHSRLPPPHKAHAAVGCDAA